MTDRLPSPAALDRRAERRMSAGFAVAGGGSLVALVAVLGWPVTIIAVALVAAGIARWVGAGEQLTTQRIKK